MSVQELSPQTEQRMPDEAYGWAFVDGEYCLTKDAMVSILDYGFLKADSCYDTIHIWEGMFFRLEDHLDRFERSLAGWRFDPGHSRDEIREIMMECARRTGKREAFCQLICTRGVPYIGNRDPRAFRNRFYCFVKPFEWISKAEQQESGGLAITISDVLRIPPESIDPTVKNFNRGDLTKAYMEALDAGADTTVVVDSDGNITEGPGFNIFAVRDGAVTTPEAGMLEGITRLTAMELCAEAGMPVTVGTLTAEALRDADEVFISSSAGGIMAVTRIDNRILGNGVAGPVTAKLREAYWTKKAEGWHGTPIDFG